MRYELQIKQPLRFSAGDRFDIEGQIRVTDIQGQTVDATPLGVTARLTQGAGYLFTERFAVLGVNGIFTWTAPNAVTSNASGKALVAVFEDSGARATLDAPIGAGDGSVAVTTTAGTIPASGFYRLGSEWGEYTFTGGTVTFTTRGIHGTTAAAHLINAEIAFAEVKETAQPPFQYEVIRDENA